MSDSRPGTGGRVPRALPFTGTTATAELIEQLGYPADEPARGCQMLRFDVAADGTGLILARLSGRELQGGETAMGQVHACLRLAESEGLHPRAVIVTIRNSGGRAYEDRPDFQLVERAISEGWCQWVAWRDPLRLARELIPAERFYELLRDTGTKLYFSSFGREVSWRQDRLTIRTLGLLGAEEREWIRERTQDAIQSRYVGEGRGWPGTKRLGFRRNWATKELEVDPIQWEFVKRIHFGLGEVGAEPSGIRSLAEKITSLGCTISAATLQSVLRDPIYVSGEYSVRVGGVETPQRPIPIADPIAPALFAWNQQLLDTRRGKQTRTRVGEFLLNALPFSHRPCRELRDRRGLQPLLRGRCRQGSELMRYRHSPWVPEGCRGFVLDRDEVEPPVIEALLGLAANPQLNKAWLASHPIPALGNSLVLDAEGQASLRQRIRQRQRQKAQLTRVFLDRATADDAISTAAYWELVGAISDEIAELRARLASAEAATASVPTVDHEADLLSAMRAALTRSETGSLVRRAALTCALVQEVIVETPEVGAPEGLRIEIVPWGVSGSL